MTVTRSATTADRPSGIAVLDRQLTIAGEPFLILGRELHNSSSSVKENLNVRWPRLKELGLNTVLAAVTWELIEPEESVFDFSSVDFLLEGAREHGFKLVPLWFATCRMYPWRKSRRRSNHLAHPLPIQQADHPGGGRAQSGAVGSLKPAYSIERWRAA